MSGLRLQLRSALAADAELHALTAPGWHEADATALGARQVRVGRERVAVGDLFAVGGAPGATLHIDGDLHRARGVAAGVALGTVEVHGAVGDDLALGQSGGLVIVRGRAGHNAGGAPTGAKRGMLGGELLILGDAGDEVGAAMRRGTIAVLGRAGARTAKGGIAGSVYVASDCGPDAGRFLRRVSILVGGAVEIPAGFRYACRYDPAVVRLLQRRLVAIGFPVPAAQLGGQWRRFSGEAGEGALGELLQWTPA